MKYFQTLPDVLNLDQNNNAYLLKNLVGRVQLLPELSNNINLFYAYSIQDGDTPESIAHKYYGDQNRFWMVLLANNIFDAQWGWPLDNNRFEIYLKDKYGTAAAAANLDVLSYTKDTIHHYEKIITTLDSETLYQATKSIVVDLDEYNTIIEKTSEGSFSNGASTKMTISKRVVYIYDYENELNESKRTIKLIKSQYADEMEKQFMKLMEL